MRIVEYQPGRWVKITYDEWCNGHYHETETEAWECENLHNDMSH